MLKNNHSILQNFNFWFTTGIFHIADIHAYDHILFLFAACCTYQVAEWKNILLLISSFTIGHSISLALSILNIFVLNSALIEFLIPVTIVITCIQNMISIKTQKPDNHLFIYIIITVFGLIHGMGFSSILKQMLGKEESVIMPLLSFNIGIEVGQLMIVSAIILFSFILINLLKLKHQYFSYGISIIVFVLALIMAINRI